MASSSGQLSGRIRRALLESGQGEEGVSRFEKAGGFSLKGLARIAADQSFDFRSRSVAIWALGRLKQAGALEPLLVALRDPNEQLRGEAARSLGVLKNGRARGQLISLLGSDPSPSVRHAAADALGALCGSEGIQALRDVLADHREDPFVRGKAAESLALCFAKDAIPDLIAALRDESADVRFWCAYGLGFLKAKSAVPELKRLASEDQAEVPTWGTVSAEAARAIAEIQGESGASPGAQRQP